MCVPGDKSSRNGHEFVRKLIGEKRETLFWRSRRGECPLSRGISLPSVSSPSGIDMLSRCFIMCSLSLHTYVLCKRRERKRFLSFYTERFLKVVELVWSSSGKKKARHVDVNKEESPVVPPKKATPDTTAHTQYVYAHHIDKMYFIGATHLATKPNVHKVLCKKIHGVSHNLAFFSFLPRSLALLAWKKNL